MMIDFGKNRFDENTHLYTYTDASGMSISVSDYGASLVSLMVPDKHGALRDVVLGYDSVTGYEYQYQCVGSLIGRVCNRIEKASFSIDGKKYPVTRNFMHHTIHGGRRGFHKKLWNQEPISNGLRFHLISPDGDEGFPGELKLSVSYMIENGNKLVIAYDAETDADTACNLTSHTYFNLAGHNSGKVYEQYVQIFADYFAKANRIGMPNGKLLPVENTPLDFRAPKKIGAEIGSKYSQVRWYNGYDSCYLLNGYDGSKELKRAAYAYDENSGICMNVYTDLQGMQFYTGNILRDAPMGKDNTKYEDHMGFCFETEFVPNAFAHADKFVAPILRKNERYEHRTEFEFGVLDVSE